MTTYDPILDAEINSGQPGKSSIFYRLRDNLLSIIEGDASAPKISTAAFATIPGQNTLILNTAVTYSLVVPAGITTMEFDVTGGGGGGSNDGVSIQLGGAGERRIARIAVTPLETLTLVVGVAGNYNYADQPSAQGGISYVKRGLTVLVQADGGTAAGMGGGWDGQGGSGGSGGYGFNGESSAGGTIGAAPHGGNIVGNGASKQPGLIIVRY
jgi:hypothetical protein